jgi:hypothetical protein
MVEPAFTTWPIFLRTVLSYFCKPTTFLYFRFLLGIWDLGKSKWEGDGEKRERKHAK